MKLVKLFTVIVMCWSMFGCTSSVWQKSRDIMVLNGVYVDKLNDKLLVSLKDGKALLFEGDKNLTALLTKRSEVVYIPHFLDFKLDGQDNITGKLSLVVAKRHMIKMSQVDIDYLVANGFKKYDNYLSYSKALVGKRYLLEKPLEFETLREDYRVKVERPRTTSESIGKILVTPAAIAVDSVIMSAIFVTVAVASPAVVVSDAVSDDK